LYSNVNNCKIMYSSVYDKKCIVIKQFSFDEMVGAAIKRLRQNITFIHFHPPSLPSSSPGYFSTIDCFKSVDFFVVNVSNMDQSPWRLMPFCRLVTSPPVCLPACLPASTGPYCTAANRATQQLQSIEFLSISDQYISSLVYRYAAVSMHRTCWFICRSVDLRGVR